MSDNPNITGKPDSDRVSQQPHEVKYLAQKFGLSEDTVRRAIQTYGPMRVNVEAELRRIKNSGGR